MPWGAAFAGARVGTGAGNLRVGQRLFAGFCQRHQREAAEAERAERAVDDQPLHPAARPGGLDVQVQSVAVRGTSTGDTADLQLFFDSDHPPTTLGYLGDCRLDARISFTRATLTGTWELYGCPTSADGTLSFVHAAFDR